MDIGEMLESAQNTLSGQRVFGDPIRQDGVTVIPVASVSGGGGGGGGRDEEGEEGSGGGYGLRSRPAGVYVIEDGTVRWQPAVDANKVITTVAVVVVVLVVARWRVRSIEARAAAQAARG